MLGKERYHYGPSQYLLATAGLPLVSHITDATADRPFLGMKVVLDQALVASVVVEADHVAARTNGPVRPVTISTLTSALLDAAVRLLRLGDTPRDYKVLGPLVVREIVYRLLLGGQRERLCQIAALGAAELRMAKAIQMIRKDYNKPLYIARLSASLAMSPSGFHHHFKAATAMSPLQFQKHIRLQEARRLLVSGKYDAATAAYQVGYEEPSQFNREYKRQFGEPPMRDIEQMKIAGPRTRQRA
jgi:AraC-like DNA-binding protein